MTKSTQRKELELVTPGGNPDSSPVRNEDSRAKNPPEVLLFALTWFQRELHGSIAVINPHCECKSSGDITFYLKKYFHPVKTCLLYITHDANRRESSSQGVFWEADWGQRSNVAFKCKWKDATSHLQICHVSVLYCSEVWLMPKFI